MARKKENVAQVAKKFESKRDFQVGAPADYQAARRGEYLDEICAHMPPKYQYLSDEELISVAKDYKEKDHLKKANPKVYDRIIQRGLKEVAFAHMPKHSGIGKHAPNHKWSYDSLKELCDKYDNLKTFVKEQAGAYLALSKKGLIKELTSHMKRGNLYRTDEECHADALKCKNQIEFIKRFRNTFMVAYKRGILDKICSHFEKSKGPSGELELMDWIKTRYPDSYKTRLYYINEEGKRRYYEYDIFIPNLKIAIEYQGLRWHDSKRKLDWKTRDLEKRQLAKDNGIRLIVIFEDEWLDKTANTKIKLLKAFEGSDCSGIFNFIALTKKNGNATPKEYYFESSNAWQDDSLYEKAGLQFVRDIPPIVYFVKGKKRVLKNDTLKDLPQICDLGGKIWKITL